MSLLGKSSAEYQSEERMPYEKPLYNLGHETGCAITKKKRASQRNRSFPNQEDRQSYEEGYRIASRGRYRIGPLSTNKMGFPDSGLQDCSIFPVIERKIFCWHSRSSFLHLTSLSIDG